MKERPIIFSGPMVRAILEGRKVQTRRVVKPQPWKENEYKGTPEGIEKAFYREDHQEWWFTPKDVEEWDPSPYSYMGLKCPYGQPGDRLWVRETVAWIGAQNEYSLRVHCADGEMWDGPDRCKAKHSDPENIGKHPARWRKRPSIHMPRWASRITLEVTDVRVERVQDISDLDALAEGIQVIGRTEVNDLSRGKFRHAFRALWDSINAKRGHGWDKNPWVWVVQFRVVNAQEA